MKVRKRARSGGWERKIARPLCISFNFNEWIKERTNERENEWRSWDSPSRVFWVIFWVRTKNACYSLVYAGQSQYVVRCNGPEWCTYANIVEMCMYMHIKNNIQTHTHTHIFTFQFHWGLDSRSYQGHDGGSLHFRSRLCALSLCVYIICAHKCLFIFIRDLIYIA